MPNHQKQQHEADQFALPFSKGYLDWILFGVCLYVGAMYAWYVFSLDLVLNYIDQYSHIAIARQVTDSLTTGLSQLGFWPPLLHLVLAPFAAITPLFETGLAAPLALVPIFACSAVFLFRLLYLLTKSYTASAVGMIVYVLNPYVLYFAVTPMMETLYLSMLVMVAYFFVRWWYLGNVAMLALAALFVSLATMARFEGFFLLPILGVFVIYRLWSKGTTFHTLEASAHLYAGLAALGVLFIFAYGYVFGNDPLAFMHSQWSAGEQQKDFVLPAAHDWSMSLYYLLRASMDMLSSTLVFLAFVSLAIVALFERERRSLMLAIALIFFSPFFFDLLALQMGSIIIYIIDLPPFGIVFNERYGLNWIFVAAVFPPLAAVALYNFFAKRRITWPVGAILASVIGIIMLTSVWTQFRAVACSECFTIIRTSWLSSKPWRRDLPTELNEKYDGGLVLVTRAFFNETVVLSGVPMKNYIHEATEHYYEQALDKPWLFARWVVMFNPDDPSIPNWEAGNEKVSELWAYSDEFHEMYELVYEGHTDRLYRLRDEKILAYARHYNLDESEIPSLSGNPSLTWDIENTYDDLSAHIAINTQAFFASSTEEETVEFTEILQPDTVSVR